MYQDDSITLGLVHTDDAVRFSKQLPVVSVVAPLEHSPLAVVWDPTKHSFKSWKQIGDSGAKILVFTKAVNYVPFLIARASSPIRPSTTASTAATRASSRTRRSCSRRS